MSFTHVIFDLDGTLLDTLEDLALSCNHVCAGHGWPTFEIDVYRYKVGNGMPKLMERIIPAEFAGNDAVFSQVFAEFSAYYAAHKEDHTHPYPGVLDMLDDMLATGLTLAVLSNKDHGAVAPLVQSYFGDRFALAQGRVDAFPPKPAAPITLHVMEQLGADPSTTLYVGDSNVDVQTGHNAGLVVAGAAWGFRGSIELEAAGADYIAHSAGEVVDIVRSS